MRFRQGSARYRSGGQAEDRDGEAPDAHDHSHDDDYRRWSYESHRAFDRDKLKKALADFPDAVLRVKGVVFLGDGTKPMAIHRVGRRVTLVEAPAAAAESRVSRLVAIGFGSGFDTETMNDLIENALVS